MHARLALGDASRAACLVLSLVAAAPLAAQQAPPAGGNAAATPDANAANDRLRGVSKEDSLLGGPSASRDPYRSALDAADTRQSDLMGAEGVPNGITNRNGYDPVPPPKRAPNAPAPAAGAAPNPVGMEGNTAGGGKAQANAPAQAAQQLYRDPFKGNDGAAQQVYRSPW